MPKRRRRLVPLSPPPSSPAVTASMRGNKRAGTKPELAVCRALRALGYRYRLHAHDLPGTPDIVFRSRRLAIIVHGCFWHQHDSPNCTLRTVPRSNLRYWRAKLARNVARDKQGRRDLKALRWRAALIWECQTRDLAALERRIARLMQFRDSPVQRIRESHAKKA